MGTSRVGLRGGVCVLALMGGAFVSGGGCSDSVTLPFDESSSGCPATADACGSLCVDLATDPLHCGACEAACPAGQVCDGGTCSVDCGPGATACEGSCTNLELDPANCGGCGVACDDGLVCSAGQCGLECVGGTLLCDSKCVDPATDELHCGGCAAPCELTEVCTGGACALSCGPGTTGCDGVCVDLAIDPANCGDCGAPCVVGETCVEGSCVPSCGLGTTECGGECVDTSLDPAHCGGCDTPCAPGLVCSEGECNLDCSGGTTKCGDVCVDVVNDPTHCGGCGQACSGGEICIEGECAACPPPLSACSGSCIDLATSVTNCGGCGDACPNVALGSPICIAGTCGANCNNNWGDCDDNLSCTDNLTSDEENCGACGVVCPSDELCSGGTCVECDDGETWCGSSCRDLSSDTSHCGACNNSCPSGGPYTTRTCVNGVCGLECWSGRVDCDGISENGCETQVTNNPFNCGTCGVICAADEICSAGACQACPVGLGVCSNACVNLSTSNSHCGACGVSCGNSVPNGNGVCSDGACALSCSTQYLDCDLNALNGCESSKTSHTSCGACGVVCAATDFCTLSLGCVPCTPILLDSNVPLSVAGSTVGQPNRFTLACGNGNAPDVYFSFTAPSSGSYTFDTVGSSFDTVLAVRLDSCAGTQIACDNNSGPGTTSVVSVSLAAGQTAIVVLDGSNNGQGSYVLNVN